MLVCRIRARVRGRSLRPRPRRAIGRVWAGRRVVRASRVFRVMIGVTKSRHCRSQSRLRWVGGRKEMGDERRCGGGDCCGKQDRGPR
jgi:hypothetical protein